MSWYGDWKPYVPVAERKRQAEKKMDALRKKGVNIQPVVIEGRQIASTFWGLGWCNHLESFSDYANRLPRGRTYVRNGSVCHLEIRQGEIEAKVSGSEVYNIKVSIQTLPATKWKAIQKQCSGKIGSLLELLQGELSDNVMQVVADRKQGLFPLPGEMKFKCSCPDWASMCKHVAAALYGVGARLDRDPSLLFLLRGVNHEELIDIEQEVVIPSGGSNTRRLASDDLSALFGIDLAPEQPQESSDKGTRGKQKKTPGKATKKKAGQKKATAAKAKTPAAKKSLAKKSKTKKTPAKKSSAKKSLRKTSTS